MKTYTLLKTHCKRIYFAGSGNFWYEEGYLGDGKSPVYRLYTFILIFTYSMMTFLEIMAALVGDFPSDEQSDAMTFAVTHTFVVVKILLVYFNKERIKALNIRMIRVCERYETEDLLAERYKYIKRSVYSFFSMAYGSAVFFAFEGFRKMYEGSHFVTVVTYYPSYKDDSVMATSFRIFFTAVLMIMLITMIITADSVVMMYLIMYQYKYITLRHYFEDLRSEFDKKCEIEDVKEAAEKLTNGLIEGIKMHAELLRISEDIDNAFGMVLTVQLCQSSCPVVSLLLQIASVDQLTFGAGMKLIIFVIGLFLLLALYVCNAGEITYQASLLSDSIFYCGWHAFPPQNGTAQRRIRPLVLQACAQAQRPLVMKAFKMIELTYATFLLVVRSTYSVFTLIYAQKK